MKFKKFISITLALALGATSLVSCGGSKDTGNAGGSTAAPAGTAATAEPVTLKWALWDLESAQYYKDLANAYQAKNPNITIEFVDLGSADYTTMLGTQLSGGADLDVVTIKEMPSYYNLIKQNFLEPIDTTNIDKSKYSGLIEQLELDGKLYTLPYRSDFWLTYYNKDIFDKQGIPYPTNDMTFQEYEKLARQLTNGEGADKVYGNHFHTWRSAVQLFGVLDGKNSIIGGNYDFLKPIYETVLQEQEDGICQDYATLKTSSTHYSGVFYKNQIAMMHMGSWFIPTQIDKVKSGESLATNWGVVKYPRPEGVEAGTTVATFTGISANAKSEHKAEALDFVNFVAGPEGAKVLVDSGNFPAMMSDDLINTLASRDGFPTDENSKEALKVTKGYLELPLADKISEIDTILAEEHGNIMTKNVTVDEGIAAMNKRVQEVLAKK